VKRVKRRVSSIRQKPDRIIVRKRGQKNRFQKKKNRKPREGGSGRKLEPKPPRGDQLSISGKIEGEKTNQKIQNVDSRLATRRGGGSGIIICPEYETRKGQRSCVHERRTKLSATLNGKSCIKGKKKQENERQKERFLGISPAAGGRNYLTLSRKAAVNLNLCAGTTRTEGGAGSISGNQY